MTPYRKPSIIYIFCCWLCIALRGDLRARPAKGPGPVLSLRLPTLYDGEETQKHPSGGSGGSVSPLRQPLSRTSAHSVLVPLSVKGISSRCFWSRTGFRIPGEGTCEPMIAINWPVAPFSTCGSRQSPATGLQKLFSRLRKS